MDLCLRYNLNGLINVPVVYAIQLAPCGPIQLGATNDLPGRYREIQIANPFPLLLIAAKRYSGLMLAQALADNLLIACQSHHLHASWIRPEAIATVLDNLPSVPLGDSIAITFKEPLPCPTNTPELQLENGTSLGAGKLDLVSELPPRPGQNCGDTATVTSQICLASQSVESGSPSRKVVSTPATCTASACTGSTAFRSKPSKRPKGRGGR